MSLFSISKSREIVVYTVTDYRIIGSLLWRAHNLKKTEELSEFLWLEKRTIFMRSFFVLYPVYILRRLVSSKELHLVEMCLSFGVFHGSSNFPINFYSESALQFQQVKGYHISAFDVIFFGRGGGNVVNNLAEVIYHQQTDALPVSSAFNARPLCIPHPLAYLHIWSLYISARFFHLH